ncbi:hypothetical protein ACWKSP_33515 [Micromonosporaceae bacterium Da 78-11]
MRMRFTAERILAEAVTEAEKTASGVHVTATPWWTGRRRRYFSASPVTLCC